jgi:hypothetical protein
MKSVSYVAAVAASICAVFGAAHSAQAWSHSNTGQYFTYYTGSYELCTDEWGSTAAITMYYNSATNWDLYCNYTGGGVKAYPHTQVSDTNSIGTTISASFNGSPGSGTYDESFDNWDSNGDEFMIWESWGGGAGPLGSEIASNVSIDGADWNVYEGNDGHTCISFLRTSQRTSGSEAYVNDFTQWAYYAGKTSSEYMNNFQFGFEVSSTSGWQNFTLNSFSASW